MQLCHCALVNKGVINTHAHQSHVDTMSGKPLGNGTAQATCGHTFLNSDYLLETLRHLAEYILVNGLEVYHVVVRHIDALIAQGANGSQAQDSHVVTIKQLAPMANGLLSHVVVPVNHLACTARITNGEWSATVTLSGVHKVAQGVLVHGGGNCHARDSAHERQVEEAMVRHTILAH